VSSDPEPREIVQPGEYSYVSSPYVEAIASVAPDETVVVHTEDAFTGRIQARGSAEPGPGRAPEPADRTDYVEGAGRGDTLADGTGS
jgi:acetamidase/formamidase